MSFETVAGLAMVSSEFAELINGEKDGTGQEDYGRYREEPGC
jgi:hypothetical protein